MDKDFLKDYEQRELEFAKRFVNSISEGKFVIGKDEDPYKKRYTKIQEPITELNRSEKGVFRESLWAQIPFSGSSIMALHPFSKNVFEEQYSEVRDIPKIVDFVKETGRLQLLRQHLRSAASSQNDLYLQRAIIATMIEQSEYQRILSLAKRSLIEAPKEIKKSLPPILSRLDITTFVYDGEFYCILALVTKDEAKRLKEIIRNQKVPFPYLVKPEVVRGSVAISFDKSRYAWIDHVSVKDMFAFSLGKDCTIILNEVSIAKSAEFEYTIDLAYLVSFGDEITKNNLSKFMEDLIAYSIEQWKTGDRK